MDQYAFRSRLEHLLHPWVAFLVLPVFALFNASVSLSGGGAMLSPVTTGVFLRSQPTTQLTSSPSTSKIVAFYNPTEFIAEEDGAWR